MEDEFINLEIGISSFYLYTFFNIPSVAVLLFDYFVFNKQVGTPVELKIS